MRLCDFLRKLKGNFTVRLYNKEKSMIREDILSTMNKECTTDFDPLNGFKSELWEIKVLNWGINDNIVNILLDF